MIIDLTYSMFYFTIYLSHSFMIIFEKIEIGREREKKKKRERKRKREREIIYGESSATTSLPGRCFHVESKPFRWNSILFSLESRSVHYDPSRVYDPIVSGRVRYHSNDSVLSLY